jgi:antitoxin (DNA-binding transcriptional repressor) of toxin-antitoxin stability system
MRKVIKASIFKAQCLELMDTIARTGDTLVITKRGRPVAQVGPVIDRPTTLIGLHKGSVSMKDDLVASVAEPWDVAE